MTFTKFERNLTCDLNVTLNEVLLTFVFVLVTI